MTRAPSHEPHLAFRSRDFRVFYFGRLANNLGTNVMIPTLGWQIYDLTHNPMSLGLIGLSVFVPVALMTLPSGQAADRFERRSVYRLFQLSLMVCALSFLALTALKVTNPLPFYGAAALFGASKTFSAPSATAWMPRLVPREHLPNAVAWTSSAFQLTSIAGPSLAGVILRLSGETAAYTTAAALYLISFCLASLVRTRSRGGDARPLGLSHLLAGIHYIRASPLILGATTMDLFAVLLGGATALLPIYAKDILHVGTAGFGVLRSAPAVGAVATALLLAFYPLRRRVGVWLFGSVTVFGVATIVFGLSRAYGLSIGALVVLGAANMVGAFIRTSLMQLTMHDDMRGRVSSVNMVFGSASGELGDMESGFVASLIGAVPAVVLGGIGTLLVAGLWAWWFPALRNANQLIESPVAPPEPITAEAGTPTASPA